MKTDLLARLEIIKKTPELDRKFRLKFGTDYSMIKTFIIGNMIKPKAVKEIEALTPDYIAPVTGSISVNIYTTSALTVLSIEYSIPDETKRDICNALTAFRKDPNILSCEINGHQVWATTKLFDSTIDDGDRKQIQAGSIEDDFRSDIQYIIIKRSGAVSLKAYSKWSEDFITFEIE
tara:strand:+ start:1991 stop:2521 length:531 start_codon:yes stop_codon:yes gene_type:complete